MTASSSPAISRGSSVDQGPQRQHYSSIPVAPLPSMGTPTIQTPQSEFFPQDIEASSNTISSGPSYAIGDSSSPGWMATDTDSDAMAKPRDPNAIWRPSFPPNMGGQLSPYADPSASSTAWAGSNYASANEMGWNSSMPPPPRSMSFSGEMLGSHHTPQYYPVPQHNQIYERHSQQFPPMYSGGVPVGEADEGIEQAIDPAIMGSAVPSAAPMAWQQQAQQQPQQLIPQHQQHQMTDTQAGVYRTWGEYGEGDRPQHM